MPYILLIAVTGVLLLQWTDSIPPGSVGGSLVIAMAFFLGAFVVAIYEAVVQRRGVLGWLVNIVVAFFGAVIAAQIGGVVVILLLSPLMTGSSMVKSGGTVMSMGLALSMIITLLGSWYALQLVNRWRDKERAPQQPASPSTP